MHMLPYMLVVSDSQKEKVYIPPNVLMVDHIAPLNNKTRFLAPSPLQIKTRRLTPQGGLQSGFAASFLFISDEFLKNHCKSQ